MKTTDFLRQHDACSSGAKWALSISKEMSDVWDAMIKEGKHAWLIWTLSRPGVFPESVLRKLACRFVRETPLADGRKVWDLLTDERSRKAVEVAERYREGKATDEELHAAHASADAAFHAADAAFHAADVDARAARAYVYDAAYASDTAYTAAHALDAACAADRAVHTAYAAARAADAAAKAAYVAYAVVNASVYAADVAAHALDAACAVAKANASVYASDAADADAQAKAAQIKMIAEIGNPFKERTEK